MHGASFALLVLAAVAAMATPPPPADGPILIGRTRPNSRNPQGKAYRKSLVEAERRAGEPLLPSTTTAAGTVSRPTTSSASVSLARSPPKCTAEGALAAQEGQQRVTPKQGTSPRAANKDHAGKSPGKTVLSLGLNLGKRGGPGKSRAADALEYNVSRDAGASRDVPSGGSQLVDIRKTPRGEVHFV